MAAFPRNREFTHVHLKVIAISQLYRARVKNIDAEPLTQHIWSMPNLDGLLAAGSPDVVGLIHDCSTTRNQYYSLVRSRIGHRSQFHPVLVLPSCRASEVKAEQVREWGLRGES
jgi:hypothetical protein